jgi:hypothetical protein
MERVTLRDPGLAALLARHCVVRTRDLRPGYRGVEGDDERLDRVARALAPGDVASNVAVLFSLADGRLLHVVPGFSPPERLARELDVALALRDAIRGKTADEARRVAARLHAAWARTRPELRRAHELLVRRPLVDASLVTPADWIDPSQEADAGPGPGKVVITFGE